MTSQKPQPYLMLFVVGLAFILAAGLFLAVRAMQNRPESADNREVVTVAGQPIRVSRDVSKAVRLLTPEEVAVAVVQPEAAPVEAQPAQPAPVETPVLPAAVMVEPTAVPPAVVAPVAVEKIIITNLAIGSGDTLYSISQRIDTSIALMADRGISQDDIVPGTTIPLPIGNPAYCPGRRPYAVGEGDTAFSIGKKFNVSAEELRTINTLDEAFTVRVADILCVP